MGQTPLPLFGNARILRAPISATPPLSRWDFLLFGSKLYLFLQSGIQSICVVRLKLLTDRVRVFINNKLNCNLTNRAIFRGTGFSVFGRSDTISKLYFPPNQCSSRISVAVFYQAQSLHESFNVDQPSPEFIQ